MRFGRYSLCPNNVDPYLPSSFGIHVMGTATCEPLRDVLAFGARFSPDSRSAP
jgi:hypothetical protein